MKSSSQNTRAGKEFDDVSKRKWAGQLTKVGGTAVRELEPIPHLGGFLRICPP